LPEVFADRAERTTRSSRSAGLPRESPDQRHGSAATGDVDAFAVTLRKALRSSRDGGERTAGLGSPMDGMLEVARPEDSCRRNDDAHRQRPLDVFHAPANGTFLVRAFAFPAVARRTRSASRGDAFVYGLTPRRALSSDHAYPLAVPREAPGRVEGRRLTTTRPPGSLRRNPSTEEDRVVARSHDSWPCGRGRLDPPPVDGRGRAERPAPPGGHAHRPITAGSIRRATRRLPVLGPEKGRSGSSVDRGARPPARPRLAGTHGSGRS